MSAAVFSASYSDFRLIKTRGVVSISFEVPVEQAQLALDVLGGMPVAAAEVHCAIARLNPGGGQSSAEPSSARKDGDALPNREFGSPDRGQSKTAWRDMRLPNQAGVLCENEAFRRFIGERAWKEGFQSADDDAVVGYVRNYCGVKSRSDIRPRTPSGDRWTKLVDQYRAWMHQPEYA